MVSGARCEPVPHACAGERQSERQSERHGERAARGRAGGERALRRDTFHDHVLDSEPIGLDKVYYLLKPSSLSRKGCPGGSRKET